MIDVAATDKVLESGESLEGWVFFEWPSELRRSGVSTLKLRLTVKNVQNETAEAVLNMEKTEQEPGVSLYGGGGIGRGMDTPEEDLSKYPVRPYRD